MADFRKTESPAYGVCLACGTAQHPEGFMDLIAETNIVRENYEIAGTVDVVLCFDCVNQAGMAMGMLNTKDADGLRSWVDKILEDNTRLADEAAAWAQRYENIVEVIGSMSLKGRDDSSEYSLSGGAVGEPSADLRIPEGTPESSQPTKKRASKR